jgi:hypothetical protein
VSLDLPRSTRARRTTRGTRRRTAGSHGSRPSSGSPTRRRRTDLCLDLRRTGPLTRWHAVREQLRVTGTSRSICITWFSVEHPSTLFRRTATSNFDALQLNPRAPNMWSPRQAEQHSRYLLPDRHVCAELCTAPRKLCTRHRPGVTDPPARRANVILNLVIQKRSSELYTLSVKRRGPAQHAAQATSTRSQVSRSN